MATTAVKATHFTNKRLTMVQKEKFQASGYGETYPVRAKICQRIKGQASWNYLGHNGAFVFDNFFFSK